MDGVADSGVHIANPDPYKFSSSSEPEENDGTQFFTTSKEAESPLKVSFPMSESGTSLMHA